MPDAKPLVWIWIPRSADPPKTGEWFWICARKSDDHIVGIARYLSELKMWDIGYRRGIFFNLPDEITHWSYITHQPPDTF